MISFYLVVPPAILSLFLLRYIIRRVRWNSITNLPGPPSSSWLVGNLPELMRPKEVGDADFEWARKYGPAVSIKGVFGNDILHISDPKALQYILNTAGYNFPKPGENGAITSIITGKGIIWAQGAQHARHRKIMNPGFSYSSLRVFLPLFHRTAQRTVSKWRDIISQSGKGSAVIDTPGWLARTTLDAIGEAAFDYSFNAIEEEGQNVLAKAYSNLFADSFLNLPDSWIVFQYLWGSVPEWINPLLHKIPSRTMRRLSNYMKVARSVATSLLERQVQYHEAGKEGGKDVMSILIRANLSEDKKRQLSKDEIISQLTTLMLAGHETTASTVMWALHELSLHPEYQNRIRDEIKATQSKAAARGDSELSVADLDSMKYLLALMKETLRYHPIVVAISREAGRDDVIPLSAPVKTKTGEMITSIPVSKGQKIFLGIAAYNRLKYVWGDDAHTWRPERFLEGVESNHTTNLGVFANLASFSSGLRSCIGWRFAIIEMQAILIELLGNFEFSPPPGNIEIIRGPIGIMSPMIKDSKSGRTELPLTVTPVM